MAMRFTPGTGLMELGTLGGWVSDAIRMNQFGDVIGTSNRAGEIPANFYFRDGVGMVDIGDTYDARHVYLNDEGWTAGSFRHPSMRAFVWTSTQGFIDLNALLPPGADVELLFPLGLNNNGQVAMYGVANGVPGIYRMTIHQLPAPASIVPVALIAMCYRRRR